MIASKVVIGFLSCGQLSLKYLADFWDSLKQQTFSDYRLAVLDNSAPDDKRNYDWLRAHDPELKIIRPEKNLGFASGFNLLIAEAVRAGAEYFLIVNPDTYLSSQALELLVKTLDCQPAAASAAPKVLKWDFEKGVFTKTIDTCGLRLLPGLRFIDIGQGEVDRGQYDCQEILGPSGCAGLFRLKALEQIKIKDGEYFDRRFFMYKEDCDLAYRLRLAGWTSALVGGAVIYHDRTVSAVGRSLGSIIANRRNKNLLVRRWSFAGQQLLFKKYWRQQKLMDRLLALIWAAITTAWVRLFEPEIFTVDKENKKN